MTFDPDEYLKEPFDPDAYLKGAPRAPEGTYPEAFKSAIAGVGSMADTALSTLAGGAAAVFGDDEEAIRIADELEARRKQRNKWANPREAEFSTGQKLAGALGTLPMQVVGAGFSPATTVDTMRQAGETDTQALKAGAVDALGNIVGIALPGWKQGSMAVRGLTGAAAGAGQDYVTKAAIQALAETEKGKKAFEPSASDAVVSGLIGGGMGAAMGSKVAKPSANPTLRTLQEAQAARTAVKEALPKEGVIPEAAPSQRRATPDEIANQEALNRQAQYESVHPQERDMIAPEHPTQMELPLTDNPVEGMAKRNIEQAVEETGQLNLFEHKQPDAVAPEALKQQQMEQAFQERPQTNERVDTRLAQEEAKAAQEEFLQRAEEKLRAEQEVGPLSPGPLGSKQRAAFNTRTRKQGGAINPEVFKEGFEKIKELGNGLKLRAVVNDMGLLEITANKEGKVVGKTEFSADDWSVKGSSYNALDSLPRENKYDAWSVETKVEPHAQRQGVASEIYKFTSELGNDIRPASSQTEAGKAMWEGFEKKGLASQGKIPFNFKKQGGGVFFGSPEEKTKIENSTIESPSSQIPPNPKTVEVVEKALKEGRDGKLWTYMQSGATSAAMKTGSAAVKAASEIIQNGVKRSEQAVRQFVFPAEHALRRLSQEELTTLKDVFMEEGKTGRRFDADLLESTLSTKQLEAYVNMRNMFDDTLAAQNAARATKDQPQITPNEAYMASRWHGDFRRPVHDKNGKLVWYLASNSKMGIEAQSKALLKEFPDLVIDPKKDHVVRSSTGKTDLQSMYTTMLDLLGRDDPAVAKIKQAIEDQTSAEAQTTLAQEKHFENKAGIRGFVGERPGHGGTKEALAMFQEQIQYAKNAYKWSEMQKAADDIKGIVSDERLQDQQPNNVKYIREYFKNAIGHGESKAMRAIEDSFREGLGVSPKVVNEAIGDLKSTFILQKLAVSAGYTTANMIQASNTLPYLMDLRAKGFKGNPAIALGVGVPMGVAMAAAHYSKALGGEYLSRLPNQFFKDAFQYAENNGVTSRSIYDEGPLAGSFGGVHRVAELLGKTMTAPEVMVRSVAFMTYAQMLKDSGKFTNHNKMFQLAEEYVNKSMVDYRETERPLLFSKMGGAGNFLNTLQTYPMSFYNQYAYMGHEAFKNKNPTPLITSLALQGLVAGALGVPYAEDAYKLFMFIKDNLVPTGAWAKMKDSPLLSDPKLWMMETLGKGSVYGALSENTGLGLTSRVAAPGVGAMLQSPVGPAVDIAKQVGALGSAAVDPTNPQKWAQVGIKSIPTGLLGLFETAPFMKDLTYVERPDGKKVFMKTSDLAAREGKYARTPEEIAMRKWGLRSQKEVAESDITYATEHANQVLKEKSGKLVGEYYNAVRNGDLKKAAARMKLYIELTGKEISDPQAEAEIKKEFTTKSERLLLKEGSPSELLNNARMQKLINTEFSQ